MCYQRTKRAFDLGVASLALLFLAPLLAFIAVMVRLKLGKGILFTQERPGLGGKPFRIYKFRTMTDAKDRFGKLLPDQMRLPHFGALLRSTSVDELPELLNVLKGEMSIVGPRPLLMQYLSRYTEEQMHRHDVKPGITGWAQIHGRNAISWEEKFQLDVWYVNNCSLWLDIKILCLTIWKTIKREGISHPGHATMEEFQGTQNQVGASR